MDEYAPFADNSVITTTAAAPHMNNDYNSINWKKKDWKFPHFLKILFVTLHVTIKKGFIHALDPNWLNSSAGSHGRKQSTHV